MENREFDKYVTYDEKNKNKKSVKKINMNT